MSATRPDTTAQQIHPALLDRLLRAGAATGMEDLAAGLNLSLRTLRDELDRLSAAGCAFDEQPGRGVKLASAGLASWCDYLEWALGDARGLGDERGLGDARGLDDARGPADERAARRIVQVYQSTASTQDVVRRIIAAHGEAADGAVAAAHEQTAGRGRLGRRWLAPAGACVTFSRALVARQGDALASVDRLALAVAVGVARAIESAAGPDAPAMRIKWPNDIIAAGRKIAGILIETQPASPGKHGPAAIIGIGVNVALTLGDLTAEISAGAGDIAAGAGDIAAGAGDISSDADDVSSDADEAADLSQRVTSLAMLGRPVDRLRVLVETIRHTDAVLRDADPAGLLDEWRRRSTLLSQRITARCDGRTTRGQVIDLDPAEGLIVRTDDDTLVHLPAGVTTVL